jgi:hypothetical protein
VDFADASMTSLRRGGPAAACIGGNVPLTALPSTLFILRYVAQLPVNLPSGCPEIGS